MKLDSEPPALSGSGGIDDMKRYGYTEAGKQINAMVRHKHYRENITVIAAMSNNNLIATEIITGTVNAESYAIFLSVYANEFKNKIVVQDNARCHHAVLVKETASALNINMKFNPAYSPEFNPIELLFNKVKGQFRKMDHNNLQNDILHAFTTVTSENCRSFYKKTSDVINSYKTIKKVN